MRNFMEIHIPTAFLIITIISFCLAFSIGLVTWRNDVDGLWTWSFGLGANGLAYFFLYGRGWIPDIISIVGGNSLISVALSMFYLAVCRFLSKKISRAVVWIPPLLLSVLLLLPVVDYKGRLVVGNLIFLFQLCMILKIQIIDRPEFTGRGWYVVFVGVMVSVIVTTIRILVSIFFPDLLRSLFSPSVMQTITYLSSLTTITLASNGFLMMAVERSAEGLRIAAMKDKLTDCWNRLRVEEFSHHEMQVFRRYGKPVSMIIADLDYFKLINDKYGHWGGDEVLIGFSKIVRQSIRSIDLLGRWGGEEFIILLPGTTGSEALIVAERVRTQLENHVFPSGQKTTVSLGIAEYRSGDSWESWIRNADTALYRAKTSGRNRAEVYN
jgi:diguanylate cyclase (GGDEF)-like protein